MNRQTNKEEFVDTENGSAAERNNAIDIFRFFCAIMVVAIHTYPFMDSNKTLGYVMTQVIPRIAVPFFFLTSGYFFINKLRKGGKCFGKTVSNLLKIYIIWSAIYYLKDFLICIKNDESILQLMKRFVIGFFITGSSVQFWFFPALFFAIIVAVIAYKVKMLRLCAGFSIVLYVIGLFCCSYYYLGIKIPVISDIIQFEHIDLIRRVCMMGFPFFMLGYFIPSIVKKINISVIHILVSVCIFILEIIFVNVFSLQSSIIITIGLYIMLIAVFCWLLQNPFSGYSDIAVKCHKYANFMFYVHPLNIYFITFFELPNIVLFLLVVIMSIIEGAVLMKIDNKKINILFG